MNGNVIRFRKRKFPSSSERRWWKIASRSLVAIIVLVWGFAAYQFGVDRSTAVLSDAWSVVRHHTIGSTTTAEGVTLRRMAACLGPVRINCVVDGDTLWVDGEKIRISGIDAPEIEGKCRYERDLAEQAKRRLGQLLSAEPFSVASSGKDRYGRALASVYLRDSGDVGIILVREGLARTWTGRRMPWC